MLGLMQYQDLMSMLYLIEKNPFNNKFTYYFKDHLDMEKMNECCLDLLDHKDFKCFSKSNTDVKTYICDITSAQWKEVNNEFRFNITADRFLRNMVRSIVGTMIDVGRSRISHEVLKKFLNQEVGVRQVFLFQLLA